MPIHLHRAPVVLGVDGGNLIGIEAGVGDQVGEQFAFVAGALQAGVEAHIKGVAVFLQHHGRELLEAEVACIDPVGIDIDRLVAVGPHLGIGADGALHLGAAVQIDRDPQAGGADRLQQRLIIGLKRRGLGAGSAEHIVQQGVAIGSGEQLRQVGAGLRQGLVPQAGRRGAQHRQAVVHHHVLHRGVVCGAEGQQQGRAAGEAAVAAGEHKALAAAGADRIEGEITGRLEAVLARAAIEIQRAVDTGLAEVVADALEAGSRRHGAFKAIAEAGALGISARQGAAAGAEGIESIAVHQLDRRQAAQQGRIVHGHHLDAAAEVGVGGVQPAVVAAAAARARQHRIAVLGGGVAVVGVGEIHARGGGQPRRGWIGVSYGKGATGAFLHAI